MREHTCPSCRNCRKLFARLVGLSVAFVMFAMNHAVARATADAFLPGCAVWPFWFGSYLTLGGATCFAIMVSDLRIPKATRRERTDTEAMWIVCAWPFVLLIWLVDREVQRGQVAS